MSVTNRITSFVKLGEFLGQFQQNRIEKQDHIENNDVFFDTFQMQIKRAKEFNGWFTEDNILYAFSNWSEILSNDNLVKWLSAYNFTENSHRSIAIIMAGNIPLVGFHDFISVLISGNNVIIKQSTNDKHFLPLIAKYLESIDGNFKSKINFSSEKLGGFDAVIATGSNNTARYFDYYFGKYPNIIRKNRNSVAVLTGKESEDDLINLGEDIFRYFGLGCRSVSKIFVPKDYNFDLFFKAVYNYKDIIQYKKYENNYDYNKAVYLMSQFKLVENGFLMLKEDESYASPIASLFYEYYDNLESMEQKINQDKELIQCIVGSKKINNSIAFGETQKPKLWDYADGVDTLEFLQNL